MMRGLGAHGVHQGDSSLAVPTGLPTTVSPHQQVRLSSMTPPASWAWEECVRRGALHRAPQLPDIGVAKKFVRVFL